MDKNDPLIYVAIPEAGFRAVVRNALHSNGYRNIKMDSSFNKMYEAVDILTPDLLIIGSGFEEDDVFKFIKRLRHNEFGKDPFLPVVLISAEGTSQIVGKAISSGADDLLIHPFSIGDIASRLEEITHRRKKFVVTSDYIGPNRRSGKRGDAGDMVTEFEVPNRFRAKVTGEMSSKELTAKVKEVLSVINEERLERYGEQVAWLTGRILPGLAWAYDDALEPEIEGYLMRLEEVAEDTRKRLKDTPYQHVALLCDPLIALSRRLLAHNAETYDKDKDLLLELSRAFKGAFGDSKADSLSQEISETLKAALQQDS
ncbi:MAG: response regulator [Sphingomonadales bacterium]|nr:response regulator [Sphingomonadales bacterium]